MMSELRSGSWLAGASWRGRPAIIFRALLLVTGVLLPLQLPYVMKGVYEESSLGWWSRPGTQPGEPYAVITRTIYHGAAAGLIPGDRLVEIEGRRATPEAVAEVRGAARGGDDLELVVERRRERHELRVPVLAGTASYLGYHWVRFALAVLSWVVGIALIAWRGDQLAALLLGAGLLLIAPVTFRVEIPDAAGPAQLAGWAWQLLATGYRFFFPAFLLHFLSLHVGGSPRVRSPWVWSGAYAVLFVVFALITDGFRNPLAWSPPGLEQNIRTLAGLVFELMALGALVLVWRRVTSLPAPLRWLAFVLFLFLAVGAVLSAILLFAVERGATIELLRQIKTLVLALVIPFAAIYVIAGGGGEQAAGPGWQGKRRLASYAAVGLTALYGFVVAGAGGVVLSSMGWNLDGGEWILFGAVFTAAIVFSPVLRWAREMVDRRMFADWIDLEERVRDFLSRVSAELEPRRIARGVSEELPTLLRTSSAAVVLADEVCEEWGVQSSEDLSTRPRSELAKELARNVGSGRRTRLSVRTADGQLLGLLRLDRERSEPEFDPAERALLRNVAQGLSSALRNAETYLQLRRAQQDLAESERVASLGALAGGLAHEIKNPLAGLKMGVHLLERAGVDGPRLERIQQDVRRIDDLVTGLLRFTHDGTAEELQVFDLHELIRESADEAQALVEDRGATLVVEAVHPGPLLVSAGPRQLRLIVSNVLTNALRAIDVGGTVRVRLERQGKGIELVVQDDGPGIPAALREAVFRSDYSTTPGGTGLGLVLARREVERIGGTICIDAAAGSGTVLRIWLPEADRAGSAAVDSTTWTIASGNGRR